MGAIVKRENAALPSVEKARALLAGCRDIEAVRRIKAVAQAVAMSERGTDLGCDAGEIVVLAERQWALIEKDEKEARPKVNVKGRTGYKSGNPLKKAQLKAESVRARLLALKDAVLRRYFRVCRKARRAPTVDGATRLGRLAKKSPDAFERAMTGLEEAEGHVPAAIRDAEREVLIEELEQVATKKAKAIEGVYDAIVIDPPWPMEKIERDVRPNQTKFDYPTMDEDELRALRVPCTRDCHVWLWTTHRFLPMALRLLEAWDLKYVCVFVWHKPGGFQPVGLPQFNCEFALYARKGAPKFKKLTDLKVCFEVKRGKHSEKPEEFYAMVRRVTAGRRLDMFNRRPIDGFDGWGKEAPDDAAAQ